MSLNRYPRKPARTYPHGHLHWSVPWTFAIVAVFYLVVFLSHLLQAATAGVTGVTP